MKARYPVIAVVVGVVAVVTLPSILDSSSKEDVTESVVICHKDYIPRPGGKADYRLRDNRGRTFNWGVPNTMDDATRHKKYDRLEVPGMYELYYQDTVFAGTLLDDPVRVPSATPLSCPPGS